MAKYWEDWSGSTLDSEPTGWFKALNTSGVSYTVQSESDELAPAGRRLRCDVSPTTARSAICLTAASSDADRNKFTIAALCRAPAFTDGRQGFRHGVAGRISGASSAAANFYCSAFRMTGTFQASRSHDLIKYVSGSITELSREGNTSVAIGTIYWLELQVDGDQITRRLRSGADPTTIIYSATSTDSSLSSAGNIGILASSSADVFDVFAVAIATGDDEIFFSNPSVGDPPQGDVTIDDVTPGVTTALVEYSYDDTDETGYQYRIDGGSPASIGASPATITGLTAETDYDSPGIEVRAVNASGEGEWSDPFPFSTDAAVSAVKGVRVRLYDGATPAASVNDITALWWDATDPGGTAADFYTATASTDSDGWLELDLDADTALDVDGPGYLLLWKRDTTDVEDSIGWQGVLPVIDINE